MTRRAPVALLLLACATTACGKKGPAQPPAPRGPLPPADVDARQVGDRVRVRFTVPQPRGERPSQRPVRAELIRVDNAPGFAVPADPEAFRLRGKIVALEEGEALEPGRRAEFEDRTVAELPGGGVGWTVRYAVRVRDVRGRPSPLVAAADLELVAPLAPPEGLAATATAEGIRLSWRPPSGTGKQKLQYNVYRAPAGQSFGERPLNVGPLASTEFLDQAVTVGSTYRYAVRTVQGAGPPFRESDSSSAVTVVAADRFPPAPPTGLVAVEEGAAVRVLWNPSPERDVASYNVYRRLAGEAWAKLAGPVRETTYLDPDPPAGIPIAYRVTAVDAASPPNESEPSAPAEVMLAGEPAAQEAP